MPLTVALTSGTKLGPYEIQDKIGAGGMGEVYRAHDQRLRRTVALKTIHTSWSADSEATRRLIAEARAASAVSHPNVIHIYDIGDCDGITYIAMEYVEGESLEAKLARGPASHAEILAIGLAVANGLDEAHRCGVIHRDIKPGNILITAGGQVKVLDFGLAKREPLLALTDESTMGETAPGVVMGTVHYMSPEQVLGHTITPATDVFSLGIVLYRMAAGILPFRGESITQIYDRIIHHDPQPLSQFRADLPLELQRAIRRCLEKDPARRFASGRELAKALAQVENRASAASRTKIPIVVLPFEDLSPEKDNEYFSAGLTGEITTDLSNITSLAVVSNTSANSYKRTGKDIRTIAAELNVRYVIEGSVRKAGDALRIAAQLIDADNDTLLWGGKYKASLREVFEIQEEVARQIVEALKVKLTPAEKVALGKRSTLDAEAFDLYLKGRHLLGAATRKDLREGLTCFEAALARDSRYAAAYAGVAEACAVYYEFYDRNETWIDRGIESALKALLYDANLPEAAAALGLAYFNKGSLEESLTFCRRAIELDPENYIGYWTLARIYYVTGRAEEAIELLMKVVELNPEFYSAYFTLRMVCQSLGKDEVYRPYLMRLVGDVFPRYLAEYPDDARARNSYGTELTLAGQSEEGLREVEQALSQEPDDPLILYASACYFARFGDRNMAIDLLRRAIAAGYTNFAYIEQDPDMGSLRGEKAYEELLRNRGSGS
jgi:serine/threonine protein kinase/tetratricopeptide (TPR) repeat protein